MGNVLNTRILFLENRSITDIWSGVARIIKLEYGCSLLRFNRAFGHDFPGPIVDLNFTERVPLKVDPELERFIQVLCRTDRAVYLHGANENDIRNAVLSVFAALAQIDFNLVVGEVTSVYERAVEYYCQLHKRPFLAPMTARVPADQFIFLNGSSLFPLPIAAATAEGNDLSGSLSSVCSNTGKNDLPMIMTRSIRLRNSIRVLSGWIYGERLHTPTPWRKILLFGERIGTKAWLAHVPTVGINEVDSSGVIYCMHVQPESTLDTYSPEFWDQASVIRQIADICSSVGRPFFIRTHPRWRHEITLHLKKALASRVKVLSSQITMKELLQRSPTIITVSGTVLLEAATAKVPTVALDETYLSSFPGVVHAGLIDLRKFLAREVVFPPASDGAQREWFEEIQRFTHPGLISPPEWSTDALSAKNLLNIAAGVRLGAIWSVNCAESCPI